MNRFLLFIILVMAVGFASAQVNVTLHMTQKLGGEPFAFNSAAEAEMGYSFIMTRMEYYISEIKLIHDGGVVTPVTDLYLLVDPAGDTEFELGEFAITDLEKIEFSIGVDQAHNHLDPATYPLSHPLAPQNPSMQWGWSAGYRFIAIEGFAGSDSNSMNNNYQIHTIGDANYRTITIDVDGDVSGNEMAIHLQADYENFLDGINASNGLISHTTTGASKKIADNSVFVFSALEVTGVVEPGVVGTFRITPNPVYDHAMLSYDMIGYNNLSLAITDLMGRTVYNQALSNTQNVIELEMHWPTGIYIARLFNDNELLAIEKISKQ